MKEENSNYMRIWKGRVVENEESEKWIKPHDGIYILPKNKCPTLSKKAENKHRKNNSSSLCKM